MSTIDRVHKLMAFNRRVARLSEHLAMQIPQGARVLDVGCGDGSIAAAILDRRNDINITGVDVLVRENSRIPVTPYDGVSLPFEDASFDAVSMVDVLHHTDNPFAVLGEAARVAPLVIVKDHLTHGLFAYSTLRAMDWAGNAHHGVRLPYNYLSEAQWRSGISALGLRIRFWETDLDIYSPGLSWWFDRQLHVVFSASRAAA